MPGLQGLARIPGWPELIKGREEEMRQGKYRATRTKLASIMNKMISVNVFKLTFICLCGCPAVPARALDFLELE